MDLEDLKYILLFFVVIPGGIFALDFFLLYPPGMMTAEAESVEQFEEICQERLEGDIDTWNAFAMFHGGLHCEGGSGQIIHNHGKHIFGMTIGIVYLLALLLPIIRWIYQCSNGGDKDEEGE